MDIDNFKIGIKDNILIASSKIQSVSLEDVKELKSLIQNSTGNTYNYAIFKNILGYYSGYDFEEDHSIYCGTLSEKTSIEQVKDYIKRKDYETEDLRS